MIIFRRILVDVDALAPAHPVLAQALDLAGRSGAALTIADVVPDVPRSARGFVTPAIEEELVQDRHARLACLARAAGTGVPIDTAVLRGRPAVSIIEAVLHGGYDLVMRAHDRELRRVPRSYGPVDMQLLRACPCPVWIVGPDDPVRPRRIVAAVDALAESDRERALNRDIIDMALSLRDARGEPVTVLCAWSPFGEELMQSRLSSDEFQEFIAAANRAASQGLDRLVAEFGAKAVSLLPELVKGAAEEVIPRFAAGHGVELVVMGTVARTGVAGVVIGNTAERVLQRMHGAVVAIKPAGFVSPVVSAGELNSSARPLES